MNPFPVILKYTNRWASNVQNSTVSFSFPCKKAHKESIIKKTFLPKYQNPSKRPLSLSHPTQSFSPSPNISSRLHLLARRHPINFKRFVRSTIWNSPLFVSSAHTHTHTLNTSLYCVTKVLFAHISIWIIISWLPHRIFLTSTSVTAFM